MSLELAQSTMHGFKPLRVLSVGSGYILPVAAEGCAYEEVCPHPKRWRGKHVFLPSQNVHVRN